MEVVTFRLANYETPLWSVENFSAGRYNDADSGYTQYLSLHPLTPWAELLRNEIGSGRIPLPTGSIGSALL